MLGFWSVGTMAQYETGGKGWGHLEDRLADPHRKDSELHAKCDGSHLRVLDDETTLTCTCKNSSHVYEIKTAGGRQEASQEMC